MPNITPTKYTKDLAEALIAKGLEVELEHWDGHKHIDIYIPKGAIYVEIDGLQHVTNPLQIEEDFLRNYYSDLEKFRTIHIPNQLIPGYKEKIAEAIFKVASDPIPNL